MIDWTKPVQTEDGRPVTIWTTEAKAGAYPVRGEFFGDPLWVSCRWKLNGESMLDNE